MGKKFNGFVVGAVIGAAAALLFAPNSGKENRAKIKNALDENFDLDLDQKLEDVSEVVDSLKKQTDDIAEQLKSAASNFQQEFTEQVEEEVEPLAQEAEEVYDDIIINLMDEAQTQKEEVVSEVEGVKETFDDGVEKIKE